MASRFFSYDPDDGGIDFWETPDEARSSAQMTLDRWRVYAQEDQEWPDYADEICWGEIKEIAIEDPTDIATCDYILMRPT